MFWGWREVQEILLFWVLLPWEENPHIMQPVLVFGQIRKAETISEADIDQYEREFNVDYMHLEKIDL